MEVNNLFIIPNSATKATEYRDLDWKSSRLFKQTGIEIRPDDTLVQVSVKGWDRFGSFQKSLGVEFSDEPLTNEDRQVGYFAEYWPLRILDGHKEGDEITLTSPEYKKTYKLRLEQRSSKYGKISATVLIGGSEHGGVGLGVANYGEFNFERALDFVLGKGEFAS